MKTKIKFRTNSTSFLSVTFFIVLLLIFSLIASYTLQSDRNDNPYEPTLDQQALSENILEQYEKDIVFIENLGQINDTEGNERQDILFLTRSDGVDMYLTKTGMTYVFRKFGNELEAQSVSSVTENNEGQYKISFHRLDMEFVGMNNDITVKKEQAIEQQFNYYTPEYPNGISPKAFKKITIENLYKGIDLVYYEKEGRMKYDFILKAGADPDKIKMKYTGVESMSIDEEGSVIITTPLGEIMEDKPYTYSEITGLEIESRYQVENNTVQFNLGEYQEDENIVIDPMRMWATYYGGSGAEIAKDMCADNAGNIYITGKTISTDFPMQSLTGAYNQPALVDTFDVFILKFDNNGVRQWATYYGGTKEEEGRSICTDSNGNLFLTGETQSTDFPIQALTGAFNQTTLSDSTEVFILKFDSNGARQWATYYGGSDFERGVEILTDNLNNLYVFGDTKSADFPLQSLTGAYNQSTYAGNSDLFILKFDSNGARQWATYYGGSNHDGRGANIWDGVGGMCVDASNNLYITGNTWSTDFPLQYLEGAYNQSILLNHGEGFSYNEAFILKFNSNGTRQWATYYGGSVYDGGCDIALDNSGNLYVTGFTYSYYDFPTLTLPGAYNQSSVAGGSDAFILKFDADHALQWATCYGGQGGGNERGNGIVIDDADNLYIAGETASLNTDVWEGFPLQHLPGAYNQAIYGGGGFDAFLMKFDNSGARKWATYYGGSELDRARASCMDNLGNLYVSGNTFSTDFPVMNMSGAYNQTSLGGVDGMNDLFILSFNNDYCNSGSSNYSHVYISDVVLNDLSNSSGGSYYSDFTDLIMSATQGTSYPVSLSFWKDHGSLKADWRVWIDLNIDGDFDDAGELVFSVDNKSGSANGTITIPSSTSVGLTRMRISMRDGSGDFGPCDVHNSGEVEDYAIDLQPVVALPPVADFEGTPTTVTVGNSVDFSDLSLNDPTSWAWSFEGGTPLNSTDQNPTVTYYTEGTYEVSLMATNAEGSDIETKLNYIIVESGGGCNTVSNVFPKDPLTHSGTGFSSTSYDFGAPGNSDVSFVVSDLGAKIKGSPNNRYIDLVTISYTDNIGSQIFGTFSGENTNTVNVDISGPVYSVTITLEDGYDGNPPGTLSVDPSSISSCPPAGASPQIDDFSDNRFNSNILDLSVYPNPTSEFLTIRYELNKESDVEMTLTDINGQNVHNLKLHQFAAVLSNKIDVSHMPEGIYFFHMRSEDQVTSRKIIIMK